MPSPSSDPKPTVLLVHHDDGDACRQLAQRLEGQLSVSAVLASTLAEARTALSKRPALVIADLNLPDGDGLALIEDGQDGVSKPPVILLAGAGEQDRAVNATKRGALDFVTKPIDFERLAKVVSRALRERALEEQVDSLQRRMDSDAAYRAQRSASPIMQRVHELVELLGRTTTTALIVGETGTGKERIAAAIHEASAARRTGPFVAVNCAAVPEALFESELFGHEKGAFTGAIDRRKGKFEQAEGGTLFLDEIGEMSLALQPKLLRALQERQIERVGGREAIPVDVRVVAATNLDLRRQVRRGKFREDLFYRLNVVTLHLPPLRERTEDLPMLVQHFAERFALRGPPKRFAPAALQAMIEHGWPGNIRELENLMERLAVTVEADVVQASDLALAIPSANLRRPPLDMSKSLPVLLQEAAADLEKRYLERAMAKARGNVGQCAEISGLSRRSISAKLAEYGIVKADFKAGQG